MTQQNKTEINQETMHKILQPKKSEDSFEDVIADAYNNYLCVLFISNISIWKLLSKICNKGGDVCRRIPIRIIKMYVHFTTYCSHYAGNSVLFIHARQRTKIEIFIIIIIIIIINWNLVVTRWQWFLYMYTKYEIG